MNGWMHIAGWAIVHFVWQGTAVALVAALALHLCRRRSSSVRYALACAALAAMLAGVAITALYIESASTSGVVSTNTSMRTAARARVGVLLPIHLSDTTPSAAKSTRQRVDESLPWIVSAWLLGVAVLFARSAAGWWRVHRLHQRAMSSPLAAWQLTAVGIARRIGLNRAFRVVELPDVDVPFVIGCLRPIVVLPIAAMSHLNAAQIEAILAHELAHVRRHDYLVNLMQTVAETLLFYHPAVWWLSNRVREEREHCCDDVAVGVCGDAVSYVAALTELEMWRAGEPALALAATGGSLLNRARRILGAEVRHTANDWSVPIILVAAALASVAAMAQTRAPEDNPRFEVASVRPNTSGDGRATMRPEPGGRFTALNVRLLNLIINAYGLQGSQLIGAPGWISSERFDIVAKAEGDIGPPISRDGPSPLQLMIRSLLADRFQLKVHRETREVPIYELVFARADRSFGPELKPSVTDCEALKALARGSKPQPPVSGQRPQCGAWVLAGEFMAGARPLSELVSTLAATVGRNVVDRTGLDGNFDMYLKWTPDDPAKRVPGDQLSRMNAVDIDASSPSIFTALQEQLGLKLESTRGPVEVLVIDRIERPIPD